MRRLWADVPHAERMTEALLRRWIVLVSRYGGCADEAWLQETLQKMAAATCPAAVPWYDDIDGIRYWRQCQQRVKLGETRCRTHKEQPHD